ncbi:hypothetical protein RF11_05291 [Thelohanellus kitauei]|uniref:Uncharacterized protein n=1 Tax=Thelohanellus kitauei TaxID=669202 RepID=A0A0C2MP93_THEKT|nr:hypothetical protein RF11_05291 [Thelohanellus kitauei]
MSNTLKSNLYKRLISPNHFLFGCSAFKTLVSPDKEKDIERRDSCEQWLVSETISSNISMAKNRAKYPSGDPIRSVGSLSLYVQTDSTKGRLISRQQKFALSCWFLFLTHRRTSVCPDSRPAFNHPGDRPSPQSRRFGSATYRAASLTNPLTCPTWNKSQAPLRILIVRLTSGYMDDLLDSSESMWCLPKSSLPLRNRATYAVYPRLVDLDLSQFWHNGGLSLHFSRVLQPRLEELQKCQICYRYGVITGLDDLRKFYEVRARLSNGRIRGGVILSHTMTRDEPNFK